jgi:formylglycine-generating enzyme required for sulfatase activity
LEYAAAGGSQQREYPWGTTDPGTDNRYAILNCYYGPENPAHWPVDGGGSEGGIEAGGGCTGKENIAPVETPTLGAGLWGQLDLAGELTQWSLDYGAPGWVPGTPAEVIDPCVDCARLTANSTRAVRGSSFGETVGLFSWGSQFGVLPARRLSSMGFRCARSP